MIETQYLTDLPQPQRAALDAAFAAQEGWDSYQAGLHSTHDVQDLERVGLLGWNLPRGEWVTAAGRALVVELAHADAVREDLLRRVLAATPVSGESGGRHRAPEPGFAEGSFLGSFEQAALEHTVELEAIAAPVTLAGWVRRNLTRERVSVLLLSAAVLVTVGGMWVVASR